MTSAQLNGAAARLVAWWEPNGRSLPWRSSAATAYDLAVAEVLLQKTKAVDAEPVWRELMTRYPSARALGDAPRDDLHELVAGLGLGSQRTERLQTMARSMDTGDPIVGIGPYGSGVLALAGGGEPSDAPVDGNIARVVTRVLGLAWERGEPRKKPEVKAAVGSLLAESVLPLATVYALVDLGALVCTPHRPRCPECPLRDRCAYAAAAGLPWAMPSETLTSVEICAGAGGQALGLERAGFRHLELLEIDRWACETLRTNRPEWTVVEDDIHAYSPKLDEPLDLLAGGVPCPPFSVAGKRLGSEDDRDLFPQALRLVEELDPRAVMIENVRGLLDPIFADYRQQLTDRLSALGYTGEWKLLNASDYGVPQLRPRAVLVALKHDAWPFFEWPAPIVGSTLSVGETLRDAMAASGWDGADEWAVKAAGIAPTLVGGSKKHGGPDLGPTRAKKQWAAMGVNALTIADEPPAPDHDGMPRLTVAMAAMVQGFPSDWKIAGRKTAAYRQVGNAFPPPVAEAVGTAIRDALLAHAESRVPIAVEESRDKEPVGLAS